MIVWKQAFPKYKRPLGYLRLLKARRHFYDTISIKFGLPLGLKFTINSGYQRSMWRWHNRYKGQRCFVIGNGPSLAEMDISQLKDEITIGSNGIYKKFPEWRFSTNYLLFEDIEQTELRGPQIHTIKKTIKLAAIHNAYAFKADKNTFFFNARLGTRHYWDHIAPMFSTNFADIVYLGSTVTTIGLQLAFYLGCDPVYIIGVDHDYGELPKLFPPGKITVTKDNYHLVQQCHFDNDYYKIGDKIGVPNIKLQNEAYTEAKRIFESNKRNIINAGVCSKLNIFKKCDYNSLF
jgi:6-hydroxymethylpterin diphosphokinase MptE-like